jgi:hypothetical protein
MRLEQSPTQNTAYKTMDQIIKREMKAQEATYQMRQLTQWREHAVIFAMRKYNFR